MSEQFKKDVEQEIKETKLEAERTYTHAVSDMNNQEKAVNKNPWRFGTREVVYAAIGAALYAVFSLLSNVLQLPGSGNVSMRPAVVIPMFFGIAFGPIVGFITGFLGNLINDLIAWGGFYPWWDLGNGIMGLVPGLFAAAITNYRATKSIIMGEISVILGAAAGMGIASISEMWVSGKTFVLAMAKDFLPAFITNISNGLILLPLLMIAYAAIVSRNSR